MISLAGGVAVFARPGLPDGSEELIRMNRDHTFRSLGSSPELDHPIQLTTSSPDGRKIAYTGFIRAACRKFGVSTVDTGTGAFSSPAMPYSIDDAATARSTWWDNDGLLHMSMATRSCSAEPRDYSTSSWKLVQNTWIRADPGDALVTRQLGRDTVAVVIPTRFPPRGTLWLQTGSARVRIADDVIDLAAPVEQVDHS